MERSIKRRLFLISLRFRLRPDRFLERHAGNDALAAALAASQVSGYRLDGCVPALALVKPPEPVAVEDLLVPATLAERL